MNGKEYVNIHLFDLMFLIEKASIYIRNHKSKEYSMKLWEDRIEEIKEKCNFDDLIREIGDNYNYHLFLLLNHII